MKAADLDLHPGDEFQDRFGRWHEITSIEDTRPGRVLICCLNERGLLKLNEDIAWLARLTEYEVAA